MEDNNELLSFLRDCLKIWKYKLKEYIPDASLVEWLNTHINQAEALVKQHRLLHHYIINIKTPAHIDEGVINSIIRSIEHNLTGYGAIINQTDCLIPDDRVIPEVPEYCKDCKWVRNNECWHHEIYYGTDFSIDCDGKETK